MIALGELLAAGGAVAERAAATEFSDWCYDSRLAAPGQCFLALHTARRDGHAFIADAVARGCTGVVCSVAPENLGAAVTVIVADDVQGLLARWAGARLRAVGAQVIGVTGSVGKTSTKRAIATVLAGVAPTFSSRRSFNSVLGLPVSLAGLDADARFAVLEMGVDRFGEMAQLAALFPPEIAVVLNVRPTHLHYLRDEEHIAAEKGALVAALPAHGWAVLNADDPRVAAMAARTAAQVAWFTLDPAAVAERAAGTMPPLLARDIAVALDATRFTVVWGDQAVPVMIPLVGRHTVTTALAALAVGVICGLTLPAAAARLALVERQAGRLNPLPGLHGSTLLDDTYNASPAALDAALATLAALPARRRIAVLGPMLELGEQSAALHHTAGATARAACDLVITVGEAATAYRGPADAPADDSGAELQLLASTADAVAVLRPRLGPGDLVLIKGSAAARLEEVTAGLLAPAQPPAAVLVRQEDAWQSVRIGDPDRPTWLEIDLAAIGGNVAAVRGLVGPRVEIMAVLKADGYGHGAIHTARTVLQHGATHLAVATLGEAIALRRAAITAPVLILGYTPPWQLREALRHDVQLTVFDHTVATELALAAAELALPATVHVKVDTGMARLGLAPDEAVPFLRWLRDQPGITVRGLFTHLATADSADPTFAELQLARFAAVVGAAERAGLRPPLVHAANSATILRYPAAHYDLVRPGLLLYGLEPSAETPRPPAFRPALQFKTEVAQVRALAVGATVSYGATWAAARPSVIATIPVGYADGFRRVPSWRAALVGGRRAPVVGRVCMDYTMLDVTDIAGVAAGDEVVLIGRQGGDTISAEEVAAWLGTINYEVIAGILARVPRVI